MADDEEDEIDLVDPKEELVEKCNQEGAVAAKWADYMACADRIEAKGEGECSGQYFDYLHVLDKCVMPKVWSLLK
eukprot:CAMPEP_0195516726 /NCGR_PEP_ID=MMETSP0794_2-20130614/8305_1 /TAXON_ID=515487 /ORGANISM="Stephanopyxis turris, Strain CCMP 815" /LENGTH=74 /DNA_ID=CAMNT_0040645389 /DNA_START=59 /DNA_END=283 /DNA_ORIENTATION=-